MIESIRRASELIFDVHMMLREPERYISDLEKAGADIITVHQEACTHLDWTVRQIKEAGMKVGVAINPAIPVSALDCILEQVDMVLVMTVNPGFGCQQWQPAFQETCHGYFHNGGKLHEWFFRNGKPGRLCGDHIPF